MLKRKIKIITRQICYWLATVLMLSAGFPSITSAGAITTRSVAIGSSIASANTTYNFTFTVPSSTTIKSIKFQACDTPSGACTQSGSASGFSSASPGSTLASQTNLGSGGTWVVDNSTSTDLRMNNSSNTGSPSAGITANFSNVHNPSATNSTFFMRITTYSDATYTTAIDSGVVATSTAGQITVTASVDEALTFTLATNTVELGNITPSTSGTDGAHTMAVGTNATTGYTVSYAGTTLTSGSNTIVAMSGADYAAGTAGFGLNLALNTSPALGAAPSGGSGTAMTGYNTADSFKFNSGDSIAHATAPSNNTTYTFSYAVNVSSATPAGAYSTTLTYTATANF